MAPKIIPPTDLISVNNPPILIYGQPGAGKTTLAQSAENPLTLDFDGGAQRTTYRLASLASEDEHGTHLPLDWLDMIQSEKQGAFRNYRTLVVDTTGKAVDSLIRSVLLESAKHGSLERGPNQYGWTSVKARFQLWLQRQRAAGIQVVFLAHEKESGESNDRYYRPAITGGSYGAVMELCDLVAYLGMQGSQRVLDFNPSGNRFAKNPCGWKSFVVPNLGENPTFLAGLLDEASRVLGTTAAASAAVAEAVGKFQGWLAKGPPLDAFNAGLKDLGQLTGTAKATCWKLCQAHAESKGWAFDPKDKTFKPKET